MQEYIAPVIIAIGSLLTAISAILIAWFTAKRSAKKDDLDALQSIISELKAENARLSARIEYLENANDKLNLKVVDISTERMLLQARIELLENQNAELKSEMINMRAENILMEKELTALRKDNSKMRAIINKINKLNPSLLATVEPDTNTVGD